MYTPPALQNTTPANRCIVFPSQTRTAWVEPWMNEWMNLDLCQIFALAGSFCLPWLQLSPNPFSYPAFLLPCQDGRFRSSWRWDVIVCSSQGMHASNTRPWSFSMNGETNQIRSPGCLPWFTGLRERCRETWHGPLFAQRLWQECLWSIKQQIQLIKVTLILIKKENMNTTKIVPMVEPPSTIPADGGLALAWPTSTEKTTKHTMLETQSNT